MPELPEVEHVVRALRGVVAKARIVAVDVNLKKLAGPSPAIFKRRLTGARIESLGRRGKYILFHLDNKRVLLTHLRMTGKFVCLTIDQEMPRHAHVVFHLDDDRRLVFCDMRQFGRMDIVPTAKLLQRRQLAELAPEPLSEEFSVEYLRATLKRSRRALKQLLLDQTKVLGLGNIYAAEALFLARISPFAVAAKLSTPRTERLHAAIQEILAEAIEEGSTLRIDLDDGDSSYIGSSERFWRVYERAGEPCVNCGAPIRRKVQGGRSTYYCPRCQKR